MFDEVVGPLLDAAEQHGRREAVETYRRDVRVQIAALQESPEPTRLGLDALVEDVADGHWLTSFGFVHCVGCGWRPDRRAEDYNRAARRHVAEVISAAVLAEVTRWRAEAHLWRRTAHRSRVELTTDPDGTDDSDEPLTTPYPPSDPNLWVRSPEDAAR